MDKPGDISIRKDLSLKNLTINVIMSDSQCRSLFGHDFMRSPDYKIYTNQELTTYIEQGYVKNDNTLLNRLKIAYGIIRDIDEYLLYKSEYIDELYISYGGLYYDDVHDDDDDDWSVTQYVENRIKSITITPLNKLATTDPLYATLQSDCTISLPYDKWVISYHFTKLPSKFGIGQIHLTNDTLTRVHKFWLTNHVDYGCMHYINRQITPYMDYALIVEIQTEPIDDPPKEMLQYIFNDHEQLHLSSSNTITRTTTDVNMFILICSIIILIVNSIIIAKR